MLGDKRLIQSIIWPSPHNSVRVRDHSANDIGGFLKHGRIKSGCHRCSAALLKIVTQLGVRLA